MQVLFDQKIKEMNDELDKLKNEVYDKEHQIDLTKKESEENTEKVRKELNDKIESIREEA